jgi:predicted DNA-binding transcriptional regulator AlpA
MLEKEKKKEKEKNKYKAEVTSYNANSLGNITNGIFEKLIWVIDDVCRATTYKKGTIYNLVSSGSIPYRKRRGKLFFIPSEILSWVQNG